MASPKLRPISNDLRLSKMRFENPWWETNRIEEEYEAMNQRLYFDLFFKLVEETDVKRAVVLMGPRRVGKTVMMHHAIRQLISVKKIRNRQVCFINIENPLYLGIGLDELFQLAMEAVGSEGPKGWFVFFDEIQYLGEWEKHLKVLVDAYPHTKFIASGSAAAALKIKSEESGAGRFTEFMLPPLTFHEYIWLKNLGDLITDSTMKVEDYALPFARTRDIKTLNRHFLDYINFGGYPEVIFSAKMQTDPGRYIKNDIIDKVLLRDLPSLYGIQNVQELNFFFTTLVYYSGQELSLEMLADISGINKPTLKKYLEYLEAAFLVKMIPRIDENGKRFQRQNFFKMYLTNPSLRSALFSPMDPTDDAIGFMVETAILSQFLHRETNIPVYARWSSGEVDLVGLNEKGEPRYAVEIKWNNAGVDKKQARRNLTGFCQTNNIKTAILTTLDKDEVIEEPDGMVIHCVPSAVYAYNVGVNTINVGYHSLMKKFNRPNEKP